MSFRLEPRNKKYADMEYANGTWHDMLIEGLGLPLGICASYRPGHYIFRPRKDGKLPLFNEGAKITAKEASQMAQVAEWVADCQGLLAEAFEERLKANPGLRTAQGITPPWEPQKILRYRDFAAWARESGGFSVH